ncbi:hypothetical protein BVC93_06710 [Mycobacterium sp. MS1601]|uniref:ANTAR domain-containing protein n=1 Tax=Mycobacterium sp. MS1601 TaxID=1936029 RepID=UPI0009796E33|nr:ANTAR domain-containing protein [Mycobacterium sp. MS1601]AQA02170.1 hypothetical protein BVC93_06710 [Mycobacterium sp. MS1601]
MPYGDDPASFAAGSPQLRAGWFRYFQDDRRWEWSPDSQPDDRERVTRLLDGHRTVDQPFNTRDRVIDTGGDVHDVTIVGYPLSHLAGEPGTQGFYMDLTARDAIRQQTISAAVAEIAENRSAIEQAKGMLMLIYRLDADRAFALLKWRSQETNTRLRNLAAQLTTDFLAMDYDDTLPTRAQFDEILLTAHLRIPGTG